MAFVKQVLFYLEMASRWEACHCFLVKPASPAKKRVPLNWTMVIVGCCSHLPLKTSSWKPLLPPTPVTYSLFALLWVCPFLSCLYVFPLIFSFVTGGFADVASRGSPHAGWHGGYNDLTLQAPWFSGSRWPSWYLNCHRSMSQRGKKVWS